MRQPPPVGVTGSGRGAWRAVLALLPALAAAALAAWAGLPALAVAASALAAGVAGWALRPPGAFDLRWDGAQWLLDGEPGATELMIDLGGWMLLRHRAPGRRRWLALAAADAGPAWPALRATLYAR